MAVIPLEVLPHIAGCHVVVMFPENPWNPFDRAYIEAGKDIRYPGFSFIEVVRGGQVRYGECVHDSEAPARIVEIIRNVINHRAPGEHHESRS